GWCPMRFLVVTYTFHDWQIEASTFISVDKYARRSGFDCADFAQFVQCVRCFLGHIHPNDDVRMIQAFGPERNIAAGEAGHVPVEFDKRYPTALFSDQSQDLLCHG